MGTKYKCSACGAKNCKLWREYQTFSPQLFCAPCAGKNQKRDISTMDADGRRLTPEYEWAHGQRSDQIGWLVPAVTDEDGDFWGYTSVPSDRIAWWKSLPTFPKGYKA